MPDFTVPMLGEPTVRSPLDPSSIVRAAPAHAGGPPEPARTSTSDPVPDRVVPTRLVVSLPGSKCASQMGTSRSTFEEDEKERNRL